MTVTDAHTDREAMTITITAELDATAERAWQLWADPRLLERWWGPPTYPATFVEHDLVPGGTVTYFMTGPEGDRHPGWWRVLAVDAPHHLELEDGFADETGTPNPELPTTITRVTLDETRPGMTRMTIEATYGSLEAMEQVLGMGMVEGMTAALGQIDEILRDAVSAH